MIPRCRGSNGWFPTDCRWAYSGARDSLDSSRSMTVSFAKCVSANLTILLLRRMAGLVNLHCGAYERREGPETVSPPCYSFGRLEWCRGCYIFRPTLFVEGISPCRQHIVHIVIRRLIPSRMEKFCARDIWVPFSTVNRLCGSFGKGGRSAAHFLCHDARSKLVLLADHTADGIGESVGLNAINNHAPDCDHPVTAGAVRFKIHSPRHTIEFSCRRR